MQQLGVPGEAADGGRAGRLQAGGEGVGAQVDGLDVVHVEVAEAAQRGGQGVGHGRLLVRGEGALAGTGGPYGPVHQLRRELVQVLVGEGPLLALEGDQAGEPYRRRYQAGARPFLDEELLDQGCDHAGGESDTHC